MIYRRLTLPPALLLLLLCSCSGPEAEIPVPDLSAAEPRVRERITRLGDEVHTAPRDGEGWGAYGKALEAHGFLEPAQIAYGHAIELDPDDFRWPYFLAALLDATDPTTAVVWYLRAIALDPDYAPARIRIAQTLEKLARDDEAWEQYLRASDLEPDNPFGPLGLGQIALRRNDLERALHEIERAYEIDPEIHAVVAALAQALHRSGELGRAQSLAQGAAELPRITYRRDPRRAEIQSEAVDARSHLRRAVTYRDVGQLEQALREAQAGLAVSPDLAEGHYLAAEIHARLGDHDAARAAASRGLELAPDRAGGRAELAKALHALGRYDEAEREALLALESDPSAATMEVIVAEALARKGQLEAAIERLQVAVPARPEETSWARMLAGVLTDAERPEEAREVLEGLIESHPQLAEAWTDLGFVTLRLGNNRQALAAFERAATFDPTPRDTLPGLVQTLLLTSGPEVAERRMEARLEERPADHSARLLFADLLAGRNRFEEATVQIQRVLEQVPRRADAWIQLGYVNLHNRRPEEATAAFEHAQKIAPAPEVRAAAARGAAEARAALDRGTGPR